MEIKPYGDTLNDGAVQLSFTLPLPDSPLAREAARRLVLKMGFDTCQIVHASSLSAEFTMFIAYGQTQTGIDLSEVELEPGPTEKVMSFDEINRLVSEKIGRRLVIVGASTGYDAHTVGIDAIMNMKGYNHHVGLERYPMISAHNLGAQVSNEKLIKVALEVNADAILVSQAITQKDIHIKNLTELVKLLRAEDLRDRFLLIVGGPRITHQLALEIGFDAGFSKGTYAEHVATFILSRLVT